MPNSAGAGSLSAVDGILRGYRAASVFLVTGRRSYGLSGAEAALAAALGGRRVAHFGEVSPNPRSEDVERGVLAFRRAGCDVMIAVGGGSVLDVAKMIRLCAPSPGAATQYLLAEAAVSGAAVPLIAVPTTAGSGAEATHFATVYIDSVKHSFAHERMVPDHVILDHSLTASLAPAQAAASGLDALAQAIESYWSVSSTEASRRCSAEALELLVPSLPRVSHTPDAAVREQLLRGANLAGQAIDIARTTAPHALSYPFTARYQIPHGHAVGLTLGTVFELNAEAGDADCIDGRGVAFMRARIEELWRWLKIPPGTEASSWWRSLMQQLGLETRLRSLGVSRGELPELARAVGGQRLANNPRRMSPEIIGRVLEAIY